MADQDRNGAGGDADKYTDGQFRNDWKSREYAIERESRPNTTAQELASAQMHIKHAIDAMRCALPEHGDKPMYQEIAHCIDFAHTLDRVLSRTLQNAKEG